MSDYYDRQGKPISLQTWAHLMEDREYCRVDETLVDNTRVSTVWLGIDYSFGRGGAPIIFETMVFGGPMDQEPYRWSTEQEAVDGHRMAVDAVRLQPGRTS